MSGELLPFLGLPESKVRLSCYPSPGDLKLDALEEGIERSQLTLVIVSAALTADELSRFAEQLASYAALEGGGKVVPLLLDKRAPSLRIRAKVSLDLSDPATRESELTRLAALLKQPAVAPEEIACPYPGLRSLGREDAGRLFGREKELRDIVARVSTGQRELCFVGPSGSGKSSLVAAGVLPKLAAGLGEISGAVVRSLRPGDAPLLRLREAFQPTDKSGARATTSLPFLGEVELEAELRAGIDAALRGHPEDHRLVLHIDQLEELFALAGEPEREQFFAALECLRTDRRCVIFYCLRADFFADLIISPLWGGDVHCVTIAPLRGGALREAIEKPALESRVYLEPGLVERLLADARGASGILPLVQETLLQLWEQRRRRVLALSCYEQMGDGIRSGMAVAMSRRADACLGELSLAHKKIARRILLRLVHFGEGAADTRCPRPRDELALADEPRAELEAVLDHLIKGRLVVSDGSVERSKKRSARVELAHESLIGAWRQLHDWIQERRADGHRLRQLENAAASWVALGRGEGGLLHDSELSSAQEWRRSEAAGELGPSAVLDAWLAASEQAQRQRSRRSRVFGTGMAALAALAVALLLLWRWQGHELDEERAVSVTHKIRSLTMEQRSTEQRTQNETERASRELTAGRPQRALGYLLAARMARSSEEPSAALRLMYHLAKKVRLEAQLPIRGKATSLAISPDGTLVAIAGEDGTVKLRRTLAGKVEEHSFVHAGGVLALAISADGQRLITGGSDKAARIWTAKGEPVMALEHDAEVRIVAFNREGTQLLTASDRTAQVWDAATGAAVSAPLLHDGAVQCATFGGDGVVVTGSADHYARVWSVATGDSLHSVLRKDAVTLVGLSSDGARLVTVTSKEGLRAFELPSRRPISAEPAEEASLAALSPDGAYVATTRGDGVVRMRSTVDGARVGDLLRHDSKVRSAVFSGDGKLLLTVSTDKTARLWAVPSGLQLSAKLEHPSDVSLVAIDLEGRHLLTGGAAEARLWGSELDALEKEPLPRQRKLTAATFLSRGDVAMMDGSGAAASVWSPRRRERLASFSHSDGQKVTVSPDDKWLLTASSRVLKLWALPNGDPIVLPFGKQSDVLDAELSLDSKSLAVASKDGSVAIWDIASGAVTPPLLDHDDPVTLVVFHPDGEQVATGTSRGDVVLWERKSGRRLASTEQFIKSLVDLHFSPDGAQLVAAGEAGAKVLERAGEVLVEIRTLEHEHRVDRVRVSHDGAFIATASHDKWVLIWDAKSGELLAQREYLEFVHSLEWSRDGNWLLVGERNGDAWLWNVARDSTSLADWQEVVDRAALSQQVQNDADDVSGASPRGRWTPPGKRDPKLPKRRADSVPPAAATASNPRRSAP